MSSRKKALNLVLIGLSVAISLLIFNVFGTITYLHPVIRWVGILVLFALGCNAIISKIKGKDIKKIVIISLVVSLVSPVILADGLLYGEKVPMKIVFMRGLAKVTSSNSFGFSDDEMIAKNIPAVEYGETGYRVSTFKAPEGYAYSQFVTDTDTIMEKLEPAANNGKAILMVHGGAYIGKLTDTFNNYLMWYSKAAEGATVYSVDYKVAPEYSYTEVINDVVNAYKYVLDQGYTSKDIILVGDSAGGGLVLSTCMYMRDNNIAEMPAGIFTISAWTNLAMTSESYKTNKRLDANFGSNGILAKSAMMYAKTEDNLVNPYISPYYGDFTGFPSMLMQVGSYEQLLDDTLDVAQKAKAVGVDVTADVYGGMFHEFQMLKGSLSISDKAWEAINEFFIRVLN